MFKNMVISFPFRLYPFIPNTFLQHSLDSLVTQDPYTDDVYIIVSNQGDANYKWPLDDESKNKAKEELNEIDSDRASAVQTFRKWVIDQEKWMKSPTDFEFLLRFLRVRKFSQLGARETLENFLTIKSKAPERFQDVDPADEKLQSLYRLGFYYSPKKVDKYGRRIFIQKQGLLDIPTIKKEYGVDYVFRAIALMCHWVVRDENCQVNGIKVFIDMTGLTMQHVTTLWSRDNAKKIMQFYQNSLPTRMKGLHMYQEPTFFDAMYAIIKPFMKEKNQNRMYLHGKNMAKVYEHIDMSCLPDEYLPDDYEGPSAGPTKQIIEDMIADMMKPEFRNYIKELTSSKYGVDIKSKPADPGLPHVASFRKLNID